MIDFLIRSLQNQIKMKNKNANYSYNPCIRHFDIMIFLKEDLLYYIIVL